jgi:hypothetical protein
MGQTNQEDGGQKKSYTSPQFITYGPVDKLTQGSAGSRGDVTTMKP